MFNAYDKFLEDFQTIVNIDSSSDHLPGIQRMAQFFQERFSAIGLTAEILFQGDAKVPCLQAISSYGPVVRIDDGTGSDNGDNPVYDIMFLGHMDTVFPFGEVEKRQFSIQGDKAVGPGVCDMKGGLLVVLHALETLKKEGVLDKMSVCVAFNGDEETGSKASKEWIKFTAKKSRRVFVFEPCRPGHRMVSQRKGGGWFHVNVTGKEAHAGADPDKGINAVVELANQIIAIDKLNDPDLGTSAQVTVVNGGDKVNIIPNQAMASVDVRIAKFEEKQRVEDFFRALSEKAVLDGARISVEGKIDRPPMEVTLKSQALLDLIILEGKKMEVEVSSIATGGCSDGNFTAALGVPTIDGMGLVGANSHRQDEYVELSSIPTMVNLISNVCKALI
ncbi:MAG: M20 family metallopeptidase [Desulfobacteraceae bacterium]|nr:M20 family metallopeptidase [Desulfobacteraceae bacterium]